MGAPSPHSCCVITHRCRAPRRYLELLDVVGRHVQADADGDEYESDDEEGGEHGARGEDGLPSGQPLLFKRGVFGLLAPQSPAARPGHGDVSVLVFGVITRRHHDRWPRLQTCCRSLPAVTKSVKHAGF